MLLGTDLSRMLNIVLETAKEAFDRPAETKSRCKRLGPHDPSWAGDIRARHVSDVEGGLGIAGQ